MKLKNIQKNPENAFGVVVKRLSFYSFNLLEKAIDRLRIEKHLIVLIKKILSGESAYADIPENDRVILIQKMAELKKKIHNVISDKKSKKKNTTPKPKKSKFSGGNFFDGRIRIPANKEAALMIGKVK